MRTDFQPTPGRHGTHPVFLALPAFGTVTANTTNDLAGAALHRQAILAQLNVQLKTKPVDADGALLLRIMKRDASADTEVQLTQDLNLENVAAVRESQTLVLAAGLTEFDLLFDVGDTIFPRVVSDSAAIDTQAEGVVVTGEFYLRN